MNSFKCLLIMSLNFVITLHFINNSISPFLYWTSSYCIQDLYSTPGGAFFQKSYIYTTVYANGNGDFVQKSLPIVQFAKIQCIKDNHVGILTKTNQLSLYDIQKNQYTTYIPEENIIDLAVVWINENQYKLVYISSNKVYLKDYQNNVSEVFQFTESLRKIKCADFRGKFMDGYCFMQTLDQKNILYFHFSNPKSIKKRQIGQFNCFQLAQINQNIFIGLVSGQIKSYSFQNGYLQFKQYSKISLGSSILTLDVNQFENNLLILNNNSLISLISFSDGFLIGQNQLATNYNNKNVRLSYINQNEFIIVADDINVAFLNQNDYLFQDGVIIMGMEYLCQKEDEFYNKSIQMCQKCAPGCIQCDQETSICINCIQGLKFLNQLCTQLICEKGYYLHDQNCISCQYAENLTPENYSLCFDKSQIGILLLSDMVTPFLTNTIAYTYTTLSSTALLFIFIRFINFWSLVSLYYFLEINSLPFFLLEILHEIYQTLSSSVFSLIGIDTSTFKLNIQSIKTNKRIENSSISLDFIEANFQSFIIFLYSLVMIFTLYDFLKNYFNKKGIHLFEKVKLQACLEEFIGLIFPLMIPMYFFLVKMGFEEWKTKLNVTLFILLLCVSIVFPFIYTALIVERVTLKKRLKQIKKALKTQKTITFFDQTATQKIIKRQIQKENERIQKKSFWRFEFLNQEQGEKFIYCLTSFCLPFLISFSKKQIFLFFIFFLNFLSFCNATYATHWKINLVIQKLMMLSYHTCYMIIYFIPQISFQMSILACALIFVGGLHELLSALCEKVYFLFLVWKQKKKSNKVKDDDQGKELSINLQGSKRTLYISQNKRERENKISSSKFNEISIEQIKQNTILSKKNVIFSTINLDQHKLKNPKIFKSNKSIVKKNWQKSQTQNEIKFISQNSCQSFQDIYLTKNQKKQKQKSQKKFQSIMNKMEFIETKKNIFQFQDFVEELHSQNQDKEQKQKVIFGIFSKSI